MTETVQNIPGEVSCDKYSSCNTICELCERTIPTKVTHKHHLIPKKLMCKKQRGRTSRLCRDCGKMVHALYSLRELADNYDTVEKLKNAEMLRIYLKWVKDRPMGVVKHPKRSWLGGKYE